MKKTFRLFVVFHKPFFIPSISFITPIQAGNALCINKLQMEGDDNGENISMLNAHFNELTVLYYIWKNYSANDFHYWGLCHYRRYFTTHPEGFSLKKKKNYSVIADLRAIEAHLNEKLGDKISSLLKDGIIVLPKPFKLSVTNERFFEMEHDIALWQIVRAYIAENQPDFLKSFNKMSKKKYLFAYNMMVTDWNNWNEYLTLLFDILFSAYKTYKLPEDPYQSRAMGFMAERLMTAFVLLKKEQGTKVKKLPVVFLE